MYVGPMFGGKTTRMLSQIERYSYMGKNTLIFKPAFDSRYDKASIVTHSGITRPAILIDDAAELEVIVENALDGEVGVIAVDEAFMIEGSCAALVKLFKRGINIVVASIDLSASCTPFAEVAAMLPFATKVIKCTAVCTTCGDDAPYTHRKFQNKNDEIVVGGSELYEPSCFEHHNYFQN